ncbi:MAG: hypothetical protein HYZ20_01980 [Burkholderiales bacterium]|nr:hypothetical protein [Burkholderiales bacterium]
MPYAVRNAAGEITSLHRHDPGVGVLLAPNDPEVSAFLGLAPQGATGFERLDAEFVRVIEDVIDALTDRNVINITDLPETAQAKLFARKSFRERRARNALQLFDGARRSDVI